MCGEMPTTMICAWKRVENYDLCLDSAAIGLDNCVEVIKKVIELKFGVKCPQ